MNIISRIAVLSLVSCAFAATSMASVGSDELDQPVNTFSVKVPAVKIQYYRGFKPEAVEFYGEFSSYELFSADVREEKVTFGKANFVADPEGNAWLPEQSVAEAVLPPAGYKGFRVILRTTGVDVARGEQRVIECLLGAPCHVQDSTKRPLLGIEIFKDGDYATEIFG